MSLMNKSAQINMIRKVLDAKGIPSDTVDVEALTDSTLRFNENLENIQQLLGISKIEITDNSAYKTFQKKRQFLLLPAFTDVEGGFTIQRYNQKPFPAFIPRHMNLPAAQEHEIFGLDTETEEVFPQDKVISVQTWDAKGGNFFRIPEDAEKLLYYLLEKNKNVISVFNSIFDIPRLAKALEPFGTPRIKLTKNNKKAELYFRCDRNYARMRLHFKTHECVWFWQSVNNAGEKLGIPKLIRALAFERMKKNGINDKYFYEYATTDAKIAYVAAIKQKDMLKESIGANSPAYPARRFLLDNKVWKANSKLEIAAWQAYYGGISLAFKRGYGKAKGSLYDFSSHYPVCMLASRSLSYAYPKLVEECELPNCWENYFSSDKHYLVEGTFSGLTCIPLVLPDGLCRLTPVRTSVFGWFWDSEVLLGSMSHIKRAYEFSINKNICEDKVLKLLEQKRKGVNSSGIKLVLNSLYGVTAQYRGGRGITFNPCIAGATTALARTVLLGTIELNNTYNTDTDSLTVVNQPKVYELKDLPDIFKLEKQFDFVEAAIVRMKRYWLKNDEERYKGAWHGASLPTNLLNELRDISFGKSISHTPYYRKVRITPHAAATTGMMLGGFGERKVEGQSWVNFVGQWMQDDWKLERKNSDFEQGFSAGEFRRPHLFG